MLKLLLFQRQCSRQHGLKGCDAASCFRTVQNIFIYVFIHSVIHSHRFGPAVLSPAENYFNWSFRRSPHVWQPWVCYGKKITSLFRLQKVVELQ